MRGTPSISLVTTCILVSATALWHSALQVQSIGFFDQCHRHGLITRNARGGGAAEERGVLLHAFRIVARTFLLVQPLCAGQIDVAARV